MSIQRLLSLSLLLVGMQATLLAQTNNNIVDEVIWVVGDEAILRSDVEKVRTQMGRVTGNPYCVIPERIAIQKLFLHQAQIDSIEASDEQINRNVEAQINKWVQAAGSKSGVHNAVRCSNSDLLLHESIDDKIWKKNVLNFIVITICLQATCWG